MPSLGNFLRGKSKKSQPENEPPQPNPSEQRRQSSPLPPHLRVQRTYSMGSVASLNLFRNKDKSDWDQPDAHHDSMESQDASDKREFAGDFSPKRRSRYAFRSHFTSQSMSATNGLAALRINTPNTSLRQSTDTSTDSHVRRSTEPRPASPLSPPYSTSPTSTPDSSSPRLSESQPVFLSL